VTPAMAAGVSDRLWEIGDILALVEARDVEPAKRGPYKKQPPRRYSFEKAVKPDHRQSGRCA
jgi:hypothetical protein